jgi:hypothetical protein
MPPSSGVGLFVNTHNENMRLKFPVVIGYQSLSDLMEASGYFDSTKEQRSNGGYRWVYRSNRHLLMLPVTGSFRQSRILRIKPMS